MHVAHFKSQGLQLLFESRKRPFGQDLQVSVKGFKSPDFTGMPEAIIVGSIGETEHELHFDRDLQAKQY